MDPVISVLIITYNRIEDTLALLEDLKGQEDLSLYVGEILLLNNASTVSYKVIEDFINQHPQLPVQYIESNKNLGVAGGRNYLSRNAKFPYLLVLDDDVVFSKKDAIKNIVTLWEKPQYKKNNTAVITLNIYYFDTRERQKNALPHKNFSEYKDRDWFLTYYFTGAAHVMHTALFEKTGFYPEDFFYGMEEYDLSYRIINAGYTLAYDDSVKVLHKESPHGRVPPREKLAMMWLNKSKVAWRYLPNRYFYSTAIMWSLQYLKKTKFDLPGFIKTWKKVFAIPGNTPTEKINKTAMSYLKKVEARLWY